MNVKGATAERVPVSVFGGRVMLYRAGKRGAEPVILVHGLGTAAAIVYHLVTLSRLRRFESLQRMYRGRESAAIEG